MKRTTDFLHALIFPEKPFENVGTWLAYFASLVPLRLKGAKACFEGNR